jgi:hypothetical protein
LSGDDVKTENPYEQDADIDRRTEANRSQGEIHTYPGSEDVSAVGIYPVTDEVTERKLAVQVVSSEGLDPTPQAALRFYLQQKLRHAYNLLTG